MVRLRIFISFLAVGAITSLLAQNSRLVDPFDKVIISPFIQVEFVQGGEERVTIENCTVDPSKLNVEVKGNTLRIYLEGAKETPKWDGYPNNQENGQVYEGTVVKARVSFKNLAEVSLRGDEDQLFKGLVKAKDFRLKVYGNSEVVFDEVDMEACHGTFYGDNTLLIKAGKIENQQYTVYGTSNIDCQEINNTNSKLTTYGDAEYYVHASNEIKVTLFGDASLYYKGNPVISKGLNFGDMKVSRLD